MSLRLKMVVNSIRRGADSNGDIVSEEVVMSAVYGPEGSSNSKWSKWTPSGQLSFTVSNPQAFGKVLPGQFYFVDLVESDKDAI